MQQQTQNNQHENKHEKSVKIPSRTETNEIMRDIEWKQ